MRWKVLGLIVFAVIVAWFTLANSQPVTVDFLFVRARTNLVLVILLSVLLGLILMAILWSLRAFRLRQARARLTRELQAAREELTLLRRRLDGEEGAAGQEPPSAPETDSSAP